MMKMNLMTCKILNSLAVILFIVSVALCLMSKNSNMRVISEISYLNAKIKHQENDIKIYNSQLSILTNHENLEYLYSSYYGNKKLLNKNIKVTQIKEFTYLVNLFNKLPKFGNLNEKSK